MAISYFLLKNFDPHILFLRHLRYLQVLCCFTRDKIELLVWGRPAPLNFKCTTKMFILVKVSDVLTVLKNV